MSAGHSSPEGAVIDLGFGGLSAAVGDHIGHFYRNQSEITHLLIPYFAAGLRAGARCVFLCRPEIGETVLDGLRAQGTPIEEALASGQFVLLVPPEGKNNAEPMLEDISNLIVETRKAGYRLIRYAGDMVCGLTRMSSTGEMMKLEAKCDLHGSSEFPSIAVCQYDLSAFGGDVMLDAFKIHPLCIVGEMIHKNPFYTSPEEFLVELEGRAAGGP